MLESKIGHINYSLWNISKINDVMNPEVRCETFNNSILNTKQKTCGISRIRTKNKRSSRVVSLLMDRWGGLVHFWFVKYSTWSMRNIKNKLERKINTLVELSRCYWCVVNSLNVAPRKTCDRSIINKNGKQTRLWSWVSADGSLRWAVSFLVR